MTELTGRYSYKFSWAAGERRKRIHNRLFRKAYLGKTITGYKKAYVQVGGSLFPAIVTLQIAARTRRFQPQNYKCRAACAKVLDIMRLNGDQFREAISSHDPDFIYRVGHTVHATINHNPKTGRVYAKPRRYFDPFPLRECGVGIHFFLTRQEAADYNL